MQNQDIDQVIDQLSQFVSSTDTRKIKSLYVKLGNLPVFDQFLNGNAKLTSNQLFAVASTLWLLPSGKKKFNAHLKCHRYTTEEKNYLKHCEKEKVVPVVIDEIRDTAINYLLNSGKYAISDFTPYGYIDLPVAENRLRNAFCASLSEVSKPSIIDAETGIGKTRLLIDYVANRKFGTRSVAIAFPTHKLKEQFYHELRVSQELSQSGYVASDLVVMTPAIPQFDDQKINSGIEQAYLLHDARNVSRSLRNPLEGLQQFTPNKVSLKDIQKAKAFVNELESTLKDTSKVLLTTHTRAVRDNMEHKTVIFDECPQKAIENSTDIDHKELAVAFSTFKKLPKSQEKKDLRGVMTEILDDLEDSIIYRNETIRISRRALIEIGLKGYPLNVVDIFVNASFIVHDEYRDVYMCSASSHLKGNKKYIVMSATPAMQYYRNLYDVDYHYIPRTKHLGTVVQRADFSYSREYCRENGSKEIKRIVSRPERQSITYKSITQKFRNHMKNEDIYYGNTAGYNDYTGQNLAIIGTPHKPACSYLLTALISGYDVSAKDINLVRMAVTHNGQLVTMGTFKNEVIRQIQLYEIEQEILQAHGRARTIRNKCTVDIYSNFPLPKYISRDITIEGKRIATFH